MSIVGGWTQNWEKRDKHRTTTRKNWIDGVVVAWTAQHFEKSQYNKLILDSDDAIRDLEMACVSQGNGIVTRSTKLHCFYMKRDDLGDFVGACCGELTNYVYAEWHMSGAIHGRPISEKALRAKGIRL